MSTVDNGTTGNMTGPPGGNPPMPVPPELMYPGYHMNVTQTIWEVVPPIIISVGTIGNTLTIIVILRQMFRISSTSLFLLCLAFSDLLVLYTGPLRQWILHLTMDRDLFPKTVDVRTLSEAGCRSHTYLTYASIQISSWLLVAVTVERLLSVVMPHRIKTISTCRVAMIFITSVVVSVLLLNVFFLFGIGYALVEAETQRQQRPVYHNCWPKNENYLNYNNDVWPWIDFCVAFAIPFLFLTICNTIIIVKLAKTRLFRRRMSVGQGLRTIEKDNKVVTVLLICLCILFLVSMGPVSIYFIGMPYWRKDILSRPVSSFEDAINQKADMEYLVFWHAIVNCVGYLNSTCNFIFYVLSGSKFRREIIRLICCRKSGLESVFGTSTSTRLSLSKASTRSSIDTTLAVKQDPAKNDSAPTVEMDKVAKKYVLEDNDD